MGFRIYKTINFIATLFDEVFEKERSWCVQVRGRVTLGVTIDFGTQTSTKTWAAYRMRELEILEYNSFQSDFTCWKVLLGSGTVPRVSKPSSHSLSARISNKPSAWTPQRPHENQFKADIQESCSLHQSSRPTISIPSKHPALYSLNAPKSPLEATNTTVANHPSSLFIASQRKTYDLLISLEQETKKSLPPSQRLPGAHPHLRPTRPPNTDCHPCCSPRDDHVAERRARKLTRLVSGRAYACE